MTHRRSINFKAVGTSFLQKIASFGLLALLTVATARSEVLLDDEENPSVVRWGAHATIPVAPVPVAGRLVAGAGERVWVAEPGSEAVWTWEPDHGEWREITLREGVRWTGEAGQVVEGVLWLPVGDGAGQISLRAPELPMETGQLILGESVERVSLGKWKGRLAALVAYKNKPSQLLVRRDTMLLGDAWERSSGPPENTVSGRWMLTAQRYGEKLTLYAWGLSSDDPGAFVGWRWDAKEKAWREADRLEDLHPYRAAPIGVGHILFFPPAHGGASAPAPRLYSTLVERWMEFPRVGELAEARDFLATTMDEGGMPRLFLLGEDDALRILQSTPGRESVKLPTIDYIFLFGYIFLMVVLGWFFARRQKEGKDFFLGGQRVPGWAAGLSILASKVSAISFLSVPAKAFAANWVFFPFQIASLLIVPIAVKLFVPFIRRISVTSVFEYLERRYHLGLRLYGTGINFFHGVFGLGVYIYLPSIILSLITGLPVIACIVIIGATAVIYTFLGGIEAVIWTDVVQILVIMLGLGASIIMIMVRVDFSISEIATEAYSMGKLKTFEWDFSLTEATVLVWFFVMMDRPVQYLSSQNVVQRISSTSSLNEAKRSAWTSLFVGLPVVVSFYILGTLLFFFYSGRPELLSPTMEHPDQLFPFFIIAELPWGITGIVIGAIFAATMSTLDTGLGGIATILTRDFYTRLYPKATDVGALRVARVITVVMGLIGIGSAIMYSTLPIASLFDRLFEVIAFFGGLISGMFLLGVLSVRAHTRGVLVGSVLAAIIQLSLKLYTPLHFFLFAFTGLFLNVCLGYLFSLLIPPGKVSPEAKSLQIWSRTSPEENETAD